MSETLITEGENQTAADPQQATTTTEAQATTETAATQQQAGGQAAQGQKTEGEQKPEGAPESYEFKAEEGQAFDDQVIGAFSEVAKELNLSQDAAQKVLDKMAPVIASRQAEQISAAQAAWTESAKTDKEYGGEKLTENLAVAKQALDQFGTPELRTLLEESGLGNHPEVIRMFYRTGKAISEDRFVSGSRANGTPSDPAKRMFPSMN